MGKLNNDAEKVLKEAAKAELATIATLAIEAEKTKNPSNNANVVPEIDLTIDNKDNEDSTSMDTNGGNITPSFRNIGNTQSNGRERLYSNKFNKEVLNKTVKCTKHMGPNTYAQITQINVTEEMRALNTGEYVKNVVEKNKLKTDKPPQPKPKQPLTIPWNRWHRFSVSEM